MLTNSQFTQRLNEAIAHHNAGRFARAEAIYQQLAPLAPRSAVLHEKWGQLAERQGRPEEAIRHYTEAWRIDERAVPAATRLAMALTACGRAADAEKMLRRVIALAPDSAVLWNLLAYALKVQGRLPDAVACHERAVTIDPGHVAAWTDYGLTLGALTRNAEALAKLERALQVNPGFAAAHYARAQVLHKLYRLDEAVAEYDWVIRAVPQHLEARSYRLFALQNLPRVTREQLFAEHCAYGRAVGEGPALLPGYDRSPDRRLRLAIHSPDLRMHSCAYFLEPLIKHLDRRQFEPYLYHDHFRSDAVTARLRTYAACWRNFVAQSPASFERAVRADRPDILIDLTGHVGNVIRLPVFARRLAPVQITYLGYPDTTGVPAMDYRFTDAVADPPGEADRFATETLVRFAPVAWAYLPPEEAPPVAPLPAAAGAPVTFGCFNSAVKFTDDLFAAWARLLAAVAGSRLLLKGREFENPAVRAGLFDRMRAQGLPVSRVELLPPAASTAAHLHCYGRVDIALDTFPYNGTTTTCEALWMGRPVVTIRGDRHAARVGTSLLSAIGHPEWIADDIDSYVRLASELAADRPTLAAASGGLRGAMQRSALLDHPAQAARFAAALRQCWIARTAQFSAATAA